MKAFCLGLTVLWTMSMLMTDAVEARRVVFWPHSGYCASGKHVRHVRACRENGGRW